MRAFIDTNIFVYATYPKFKEHAKAIPFLKQCLEEKDLWYTSWGIIYEYLRVVTHPYLFSGETLSLAKALANVEKFCAASNVEIIQETSNHWTILKETNNSFSTLRRNLLHDVHMIILMREHDIKKIYTADTDFHRFPDIEVINPFK